MIYTILYAFLNGFIFGATMAAIPGPIFFLIVQRTIAEGALTGLFCGFGAVMADTVYALIAAVGLSYIFESLIMYQAWLALLGGVFLIYLGVTTYYTKPVTKVVSVHDSRLITAWISTFLLTIANPVTILSYFIIIAGLGFDAKNSNYGALFALVVGVAIGALSFVFMLIGFLRYFRKKFTASTIRIINKTAGILLIGFGIIALLRCIGIL